MFLVDGDPRGRLRRRSRFSIPESPRYLVASHKIPEARRVLACCSGEKNLEITISRIQETLEREDKPSCGTCASRARLRPLRHRLGWPRAVGLPAVRRHQRDLLLLATCCGRRSDSTRASRSSSPSSRRSINMLDDVDRDRAHRQDRPQAAAAGRVGRHGRHARHHGDRLRQRRVGRRRQALPRAAPPGPIALIAANLFVVVFGMSWGPVVWVLLGEMFPNRIRAAALGLAAAGQWAANWLITVSFPPLRDHLGLAYGFYALCAVLSFIFVWKWVHGDQGRFPGGHARRAPPRREARDHLSSGSRRSPLLPPRACAPVRDSTGLERPSDPA